MAHKITITGDEGIWVDTYYLECAQDMTKALLGRSRAEIEIRLVSKIDMEDRSSWHGSCKALGERKFLVKLLVGRETRDTLVTLAHELIHVSQHVSGDLKYRFYWSGKTGSDAKWLGKRVPKHRTHYSKRPWEIEAYALQELLVRELLDETLASKKTWGTRRKNARRIFRNTRDAKRHGHEWLSVIA